MASNSFGDVAGLTTIASHFSPKETIDRLQAQIRAIGLDVFARIDHADGAERAGLTLRPTELIIFGNALGGTPLMQSVHTTGIDLPLKALVWQDEGNQTWISYNQPGWIAHRHGITNHGGVIDKMSAILNAVSNKAANPP